MSKQVSFRTPVETIEALDKVAEALDRDRSYVINQAVEAYLDVYRWQVGHIKEALALADAGGPFIAHEDVVAWAKTLGTRSEKPDPKPTIHKPPRSRRRAS